MTTTDLSLAGVALSTAVPEALVLVVERSLVGKRRHEHVDVPGRAGSWIFPEEPGDRTLSVTLDLKADSFDERRDAVRRLADWADLGAVAALIVSDEPDRYHEAILDDDTDPKEWLVRAELELRFRVGPYALANDPTELEIVVTAGEYNGTFDMPGDVDGEPVIEVDPDGNGSIGSFGIDMNGDHLSVFGTTDELFPANEIVTVSSISDTVIIGPSGDELLTGAFDPAETMVEARGRFPMLVPGVNTIDFDSESTADPLILRIIWRRRFR